jgi:DNA-binding MarR family transcriptional regulator
VNRAIDSLLKKGWVERKDDPNDRRRWIVKLTDEGWAVAKKVGGVYRRLADDAFSALPVGDRKHFFSLLQRLIEKGLSEDIRKELTI